jgi:hypothetical protein
MKCKARLNNSPGELDGIHFSQQFSATAWRKETTEKLIPTVISSFLIDFILFKKVDS